MDSLRVLISVFLLSSFVASQGQYCDKRIGDTRAPFILRVSLNTISNSSNAGSDYTDFTHLSTVLHRDSTYTLTIDGVSGQHLGVYIDWNQDFDFDDVGESFDPASTAPVPITVPSDAALGITRMRIITSFNGAPTDLTLDPCGTHTGAFDFGEVEDYSLEIVTSYFSRANGSWESGTVWSNDGHTAGACNCIPAANGTVFIGGGDEVTLNTNVDISDLVVEGTGSLIFGGSNLTLEVDTATVQAGGAIDANGRIGTSINVADLTVEAGSTITISILDVANATIRNSGSVVVGQFDNISGGSTLVNHATGLLEVTGSVGAVGDIAGFWDLSADGNRIVHASSEAGVFPLSYSDLEIASDASVALIGETTVRGELTLSEFLQLDGHDLILAQTATMDAGSHWVVTNGTGSLVRLELGTTSKTFAVGSDEITHQPVVITNFGTVDDFSVRVTDHVLSQGEAGNQASSGIVDRTWMISESVPGGSNVQITFQWNGNNELTGFNRNNATAIHFDGSWIDVGSGSAVNLAGNNYSLTATGVNSFSPFAIESAGSALPIILDYFKAKYDEGGKVVLKWKSTKEIDNDFYSVERSFDGMQWQLLATIDGAGNSDTPIPYSYLDIAPHLGTNYYRLKQTDYDGGYEYFKPVVVHVADARWVLVYPNPARNLLRVNRTTSGDFQIFAMDGRNVSSLVPWEASGQSLLLDISGLIPGHYYIRIGYLTKRFRRARD